MSAEIILRQRSGPVITIIVWAFLALLIGDALMRGAWETVGRFGPALLLIGWIAFTVLWRPALAVGYEAVEVSELVRTTTVPFARIRDIRLGSKRGAVDLGVLGTGPRRGPVPGREARTHRQDRLNGPPAERSA